MTPKECLQICIAHGPPQVAVAVADEQLWRHLQLYYLAQAAAVNPPTAQIGGTQQQRVDDIHQQTVWDGVGGGAWGRSAGCTGSSSLPLHPRRALVVVVVVVVVVAVEGGWLNWVEWRSGRWWWWRG